MSDDLRAELHDGMEALRGISMEGRTIGKVPKWVTRAFAAALLPIVERRIAQARTETAEQIMRAIGAFREEVTSTQDEQYISALHMAEFIIRQHAEEVGSDE